MIAIIGANGRTGAAILAEATARNLTTRPIVEDDRDTSGLPDCVDLQKLCFANPMNEAQLRVVLDGCETAIVCIDPRTFGPGAKIFTGEATKNIMNVATALGLKVVLYMTIMGGYRWSYAPLNRKAFALEKAIRGTNAPWSMLRVSCYHDEVVEGHLIPPDHGAPHKIRPMARYAPVSRREVAQMALDYLPKAIVGRSNPIGGPEALSSVDLNLISRDHATTGPKPTKYAALPPGDVSVAPDTTRRTIGYTPNQTIRDYLLGLKERDSNADHAPVYAREAPGAHHSDTGKRYKVLEPLATSLRRVVHSQLHKDLLRIGIDNEGVMLDFSRARAAGVGSKAHDGVMSQITGIRVTKDGVKLHSGRVNFFRDELADEFECWWDKEMPENIWDKLDVGVRRRLKKSPAFVGDNVVHR